MTKPRSVFKSLWLPSLGAALALWGVYRAGASATVVPPPPGAVIGLVNMETLMKGLTEVKSRNAELQAIREKRQVELKTYLSKLEGIRKELEVLKRESDDWRSKTAEGMLLEAEAKTKGNIFQQLDDLDDGASISTVYNKALVTIGKVAAKDGFSLVLLDDRGLVLPESGSGKQMSTYIMNKRVLYAAQSTDITDRIITEMNNEFGAPAPRGNK